MHRKNFDKLAEEWKALRETVCTEAEYELLRRAILRFCLIAKEVNPRFDTDYFMEGCGF